MFVLLSTDSKHGHCRFQQNLIRELVQLGANGVLHWKFPFHTPMNIY